MRKTKYLVLFLLFFSFSALSSFTVLISGEHSKFKDCIRESLIKTLNEKNIMFEEIDLKKLRKTDISKYDAYILFATCRAWNITKKVRKFIDRIPAEKHSKILVYSTAGDPDWKYKDETINNISSASKKVDLNSKIDKIKEFLNTL